MGVKTFVKKSSDSISKKSANWNLKEYVISEKSTKTIESPYRIERKYFYDEMIVNLEKGDFNLASF